MTRYGEMGSPSKLRTSSDLGHFKETKTFFFYDLISLILGSQMEVTCLSFNPLVNKLLLIGTGHGQLNLYTTGRGKKIMKSFSLKNKKKIVFGHAPKLRLNILVSGIFKFALSLSR